jgi:hypothetical protein
MRAAAKPLGGTEWKLLTGPHDAVENVVVKRFMLAMGNATDGGPGSIWDIAHANKFALVDQNGDLRGYWSIDEQGRGNLINAARLLAKKGPRP